MEKCLVTKLGSAVSADFPKLGELRIAVSTADVTPSSDDKLNIVGTGVEVALTGSLEYNSSYTSDTHSGVLAADKEGSLIVNDKYAITQFSFPTSKTAIFANPIDIKDIAYNESIGLIVCPGASGNRRVKGNISCLEGKPLYNLRIDSNPDLEGNIDVFAYALCRAARLHTNINNFSVMHDVLITGSIESLVAEIRALQHEAGESQTSGTDSFSFNIGDTQATFKGNLVSASATNKTLSWTADTITYLGETIEA